MRQILVLTVLLSLPWLGAAADARDYTFQVEHQRFLRKDSGRLEITAAGIAYHSEKKQDRSRSWTYDDIQELTIESPHRVRILTYEDVEWRLNRDRAYVFDLVTGEITLELVAFLAEKLPTPLVTSIFPEPEGVLLRLPAKHGHALGGGCNGEVVIGEKAVFFKSERTEHSRWWPLEQIENVGSMSEFDFRVVTREGPFHFQLKRPLDRPVYENLWRRVHEPRTWLDSLTAVAR